MWHSKINFILNFLFERLLSFDFRPLAILPSYDEITIAVRCCPIYFKLRLDGPASVAALQYRIVFAVATQKSVLIYDTQQFAPIAVISNMHYTRLTDISWLANFIIFNSPSVLQNHFMIIK